MKAEIDMYSKEARGCSKQRKEKKEKKKLMVSVSV